MNKVLFNLKYCHHHGGGIRLSRETIGSMPWTRGFLLSLYISCCGCGGNDVKANALNGAWGVVG